MGQNSWEWGPEEEAAAENYRVILCGANAYEKKYYFNKKFDKIPENIKEELHIICVLFTEEVGGIITMTFDEDGYLEIETMAKENDLLYDEIGAHLKVKQMREDRRELLEAVETYFRVVFLGEVGDEE